ncbi:WXG100-like domain-containing protein, partial [Streptantibioticus ferralitis]|nr:hypothetical protein [Streptantibioticus ferralitis]
MSIMLPPELKWVADLAGGDWPPADEDKLWALRDIHNAYAEELRSIAQGFDEAIAAVKAGVSGATAEKFESYLQKFQKNLEDVATGCDQLASSLDEFAVKIEYAKIMILMSLAWMAAQIAFFIWWAPEAVSAIVAEGRLAIMMILRQLIAAAAINAGAGALMAAAAEGIQFAKGHRHQFDWSDVLVAAGSGAINGAITAGLFGGVGLFGGKVGGQILSTLAGKMVLGGIGGAAGTAASDAAFGLNGSPGLGFVAGMAGGAIGHIPSMHGGKGGGDRGGEYTKIPDLPDPPDPKGAVPHLSVETPAPDPAATHIPGDHVGLSLEGTGPDAGGRRGVGDGASEFSSWSGSEAGSADFAPSTGSDNEHTPLLNGFGDGSPDAGGEHGVGDGASEISGRPGSEAGSSDWTPSIGGGSGYTSLLGGFRDGNSNGGGSTRSGDSSAVSEPGGDNGWGGSSYPEYSRPGSNDGGEGGGAGSSAAPPAGRDEYGHDGPTGSSDTSSVVSAPDGPVRGSSVAASGIDPSEPPPVVEAPPPSEGPAGSSGLTEPVSGPPLPKLTAQALDQVPGSGDRVSSWLKESGPDTSMPVEGGGSHEQTPGPRVTPDGGLRDLEGPQGPAQQPPASAHPEVTTPAPGGQPPLAGLRQPDGPEAGSGLRGLDDHPAQQPPATPVQTPHGTPPPSGHESPPPRLTSEALGQVPGSGNRVESWLERLGPHEQTPRPQVSSGGGLPGLDGPRGFSGRPDGPAHAEGLSVPPGGRRSAVGPESEYGTEPPIVREAGAPQVGPQQPGLSPGGPRPEAEGPSGTVTPGQEVKSLAGDTASHGAPEPSQPGESRPPSSDAPPRTESPAPPIGTPPRTESPAPGPVHPHADVEPSPQHGHTGPDGHPDHRSDDRQDAEQHDPQEATATPYNRPDDWNDRVDRWAGYWDDRNARTDAMLRFEREHQGQERALQTGYENYARNDLFGGRWLPKDGVGHQQAVKDFHRAVLDDFRNQWQTRGSEGFDEHQWASSYEQHLGSADRYFANAGSRNRELTQFNEAINKAAGKDLFGGRYLRSSDDVPSSVDDYVTDHYKDPSYDSDNGRPRPGDDGYLPTSLSHLRADQFARIRAIVDRAHEDFPDDPVARQNMIDDRITELGEGLPRRIARLTDSTRAVDEATERLDDVLNPDEPGEEALPATALDDANLARFRKEFQDDLHTFHQRGWDEAALGDDLTPGRTANLRQLRDFEHGWNQFVDRTFENLDSRIGHAEFRQFANNRLQRRLPAEFDAYEENTAGLRSLDAEARDRLGAELTRAHEKAVDEYWFDHSNHPDFRPFRQPRWDGDATRPPRAYDASRALLDSSMTARMDHELGLNETLERSAKAFHPMREDPGEENALDKSFAEDARDDFRKETIRTYDNLFAPYEHNIEAWLQHEKDHENAFQRTLDSLPPSDRSRPPSPDAADGPTPEDGGAGAAEGARADAPGEHGPVEGPTAEQGQATVQQPAPPRATTAVHHDEAPTGEQQVVEQSPQERSAASSSASAVTHAEPETGLAPSVSERSSAADVHDRAQGVELSPAQTEAVVRSGSSGSADERVAAWQEYQRASAAVVRA